MEKMSGAYTILWFPVDLTENYGGRSWSQDYQEEVKAAQEASKEASKATAKKTDGEVVRLDVHDISALERNVDVPKTNVEAKYVRENITASIKAIFHARASTTPPSNSPLASPLDSFSLGGVTSFYAESGGQEGDTGLISIDGKAESRSKMCRCTMAMSCTIGSLQ